MSEPTVFTKNGTVLESTLRYEHHWIDTPEMTALLEFWYDRETGELMKNNYHGYQRKGLALGIEQAQM